MKESMKESLSRQPFIGSMQNSFIPKIKKSPEVQIVVEKDEEKDDDLAFE